MTFTVLLESNMIVTFIGLGLLIMRGLPPSGFGFCFKVSSFCLLLVLPTAAGEPMPSPFIATGRKVRTSRKVNLAMGRHSLCDDIWEMALVCAWLWAVEAGMDFRPPLNLTLLYLPTYIFRKLQVASHNLVFWSAI